jgi:hypothetical protein
VKIFGSRTAYQALRRAKSSLDAAKGTLRSKASRGARRQIAIKDAEIGALRKELARARGEDVSPGLTGTPAFFVIGYQKSGTTWLMRMLDSHPEILCKGEGRFFGGSWRQESVRRIDAKRPPSSLYNAVLDAEYLRLWIERSVWSRNDDADEHLTNLTRMAIDCQWLRRTIASMVGWANDSEIARPLERIAYSLEDAEIALAQGESRTALVAVQRRIAEARQLVWLVEARMEKKAAEAKKEAEKEAENKEEKESALEGAAENKASEDSQNKPGN